MRKTLRIEGREYVEKKKPREKPTVKQILYHGSIDAEERLILIAIREHSDAKGWCIKSYGELAKLTHLSEGTVRNRVTMMLPNSGKGKSILERPKREKPRDKSAYKIHLYNFLKDVKTPVNTNKRDPAVEYIGAVAAGDVQSSKE